MGPNRRGCTQLSTCLAIQIAIKGITRKTSVWIALSCFFLLTGCFGYRIGKTPLNDYSTIAIPLAVGDLHGTFTSEVIRRVKEKSTLGLSLCQSDLLLKLTILGRTEENIDYRFAEEGRRVPKNFIVPVGARLEESATVELIDVRRGCRLLGPVTVSAYLTYDFDSDFSKLNFHRFSLGELEMHDIAEEEALNRLHHLLAQKVVDSLLYCW